MAALIQEGQVLLDAMILFNTAYQQCSSSDERRRIKARKVFESMRTDCLKAVFDNENRSKMKEMLLSLGTEALLSDERPQCAMMFSESVARIDFEKRRLLYKSDTEQSALKMQREIRDTGGDGTRGVILRFYAKRASCTYLSGQDERRSQKTSEKGICFNF